MRQHVSASLCAVIMSHSRLGATPLHVVQPHMCTRSPRTFVVHFLPGNPLLLHGADCKCEHVCGRMHRTTGLRAPCDVAHLGAFVIIWV